MTLCFCISQGDIVPSAWASKWKLVAIFAVSLCNAEWCLHAEFRDVPQVTERGRGAAILKIQEHADKVL